MERDATYAPPGLTRSFRSAENKADREIELG